MIIYFHTVLIRTLILEEALLKNCQARWLLVSRFEWVFSYSNLRMQWLWLNICYLLSITYLISVLFISEMLLIIHVFSHEHHAFLLLVFIGMVWILHSCIHILLLGESALCFLVYVYAVVGYPCRIIIILPITTTSTIRHHMIIWQFKRAIFGYGSDYLMIWLAVSYCNSSFACY